MTIDKLIKFAENQDSSGSNTDGLDLSNGFPSKLQPARQWFNWLFNSLTVKINEIIDQLATLNDSKINYSDIVDALDSVESSAPLSANMGRELDEKKLNKDDLASGGAPVFAARAWANFNGGTGVLRNSGNIKSVTRNGSGNYAIEFIAPMEHSDYVVITGVSHFSAGTNFGVVSQTVDGFVLQAAYGGDNTIGSFDPTLAMVTVFC